MREENVLSIGDMEKDIRFLIGEKEIVRLKENGDFIVEGRKVTNDLELYEGFKKFINGVM